MSAIHPTSPPWQIKHDYLIEGQTTIIANVDGETVDGVNHYTYDFVAITLILDDDTQSRSVAVANAAFIVRAVNAHADLVEALQNLLSATEEVGYVHYGPLRKKARAAIAKATGAA